MEYTIKELMKKWNLSKSGVFKRVRTKGYTVNKREVLITQKQVIDFIEIGE